MGSVVKQVAISAAIGAATGGVGFAVLGPGVAGASFSSAIWAGAGKGLIAGALSAGVSALSGKPARPSLAPFTVQARERTQLIRSPVAPRRVIYGTSYVSGVLAYAATTGGSKEYIHLVLPLAGHEVSGIGEVYFNDTLSTDSRFSGYYRINEHLGAVDQAADADLAAEVAEWTSDHRLQGTAYIYARLRWNADVWPTGMPTINAVVEGREVYDPRSATTAFSNNPALCIRDYLTAAFGLGATEAELDEASFIAAANICDEPVTLAGGGTQKRYTMDGAFNLDAEPIAIMEDMLTSCAGVLVYAQGKYRLSAGAAAIATQTLTADDLRGAVKVRPRISRRELYNGVRGTFVDPAQSWQASDFPPVTNAAYEAQDGGQQILRDIDLPFTIDNVRAQRIAKIHLEMSRQGITVEFPATLAALEVAVWDVVNVTLAHLGWQEKPFRVLSWSLAEDGGVDLVLQEYAASAYDWNSGDATSYDPAPDTSLPTPWIVGQPGAITFSEELYVTRSGDGVKAKIDLAWAPSPDAFVSQYQVEYQTVGAPEYTVAGRTSAPRFEILDIEPGAYNIRVKALNGLEVSSPYTVLSNQQVSGLLAPPAAVSGLSIAAISSIAILSWTRQPDLDVRIGGYFRVRHSPATSGATWQGAVDIGPAIPGSATSAALPLMPGTYLIKAYDSSGLASAAAASINTNAPTLLAFANLQTLTESPLFSGGKTNCVAIEDKLQLAGSELFDSIADFDAVETLDALGGVQASGTYDFAGAIDLGAVDTVRLGATIQALVVNTLDMIDDRSSNIDSWDDFDGTSAASAECKLYVRHTDDDPAGTPAWGAWTQLFIGDYRARAFQFQARLSTADPAYNIQISELSATADKVA